jgi:hypothetical protein
MKTESFPGKFKNYWFLNKDSVHDLVCFFCIFFVPSYLCLGHSKTSEIPCGSKFIRYFVPEGGGGDYGNFIEIYVWKMMCKMWIKLFHRFIAGVAHFMCLPMPMQC